MRGDREGMVREATAPVTVTLITGAPLLLTSTCVLVADAAGSQLREMVYEVESTVSPTTGLGKPYHEKFGIQNV